MFVYNIKLNKNAFFKIILAICAMISISIAFVVIFKIFKASQNEGIQLHDCIPSNEIANIDPKNYTNILKMVNEDLDTYIGQKICFSGYVYRVSDIKEDEFVLARDMVISDNPKQTLVVGFLAKHKDAQNYPNNTWVKVTATIEKGYYCGDVPILNITQIEKASKPENPEVPIPDDYYIPTAVIY